MSTEDTDLFRQLGAQSKDVYFIFDVAENRFRYLGPAFEKIWGIPAETILNNPHALGETIYPEDLNMVRADYQDFIEELNPCKFQFSINSADGSRKYVRASVYPVSTEPKQVAGIIEDISVVMRNIYYMEKINARKNSTLEILAHDLKGPLGMISMVASNIQRSKEMEDKEYVLQSVQFIQDMCKRNISMIRELVNQEFLESTEVELRKERADLAWEISDVIQNYKRAEAEMAKTFILTCATEKVFVNIDSLKFIQVINNLISNAIKFTPDNGVIEVVLQEFDNTVVVTVRDNGIGIPEDLQPFLFDKFTRARRSGLRGEEPVGLGMSVIKTIVELHRGKIWFTSKENEGSSFYIEIPKH